MSVSQVPDHYEVLQLSPRADADTISRVFRHMAKRLHPDKIEVKKFDPKVRKHVVYKETKIK